MASFAAAGVKEAFNAAQILQLLTKLKKEALALCPPGAEPFPALFHDPGMRAIPSGLFFFFFFFLCATFSEEGSVRASSLGKALTLPGLLRAQRWVRLGLEGKGSQKRSSNVLEGVAEVLFSAASSNL